MKNLKLVITIIFGLIIMGLSILGVSDIIKELRPSSAIDENVKIHVNVDKEATFGLDISHHQGDIDWNNLGSFRNKEVSFVYLKATEGSTFVDPHYQKYFADGKNTDILMGSYHFFRVTSSGKQQYLNFIQTIDLDRQDLKVMVDLEEINYASKSKFHSILEEFLELLEADLGYKPILYTSAGFYNRYLSIKYKDYPKWIANYQHNKFKLKDGSDWLMWQFTDLGKIKGIQYQVDVNLTHNFKDIITPDKFILHEKD